MMVLRKAAYLQMDTQIRRNKSENSAGKMFSISAHAYRGGLTQADPDLPKSRHHIMLAMTKFEGLTTHHVGHTMLYVDPTLDA